MATDSLNVGKTQSMNIATKHKQAALENQNKQLNLQIRNETMEAVQYTKYLGVHSQNSLDWNKQIQDTSKKVSWYIGMFKYAKDILLFMQLKLSMLVSLTLTSITAVLCGIFVALPRSSSYRSFKIGLPVSLQAAIMMPLASINLKP